MKLSNDTLSFFQKNILTILGHCIDITPHSAYAKFNHCVANFNTLQKASEPAAILADDIICALTSYDFNENEDLKKQIDHLILEKLNQSAKKSIASPHKLQAKAIKNLFESALELIPKPPHLTTFNTYSNGPTQNAVHKIHESLDSIDSLFSPANSRQSTPTQLSKSTSTSSLLSDTFSSFFSTSASQQQQQIQSQNRTHIAVPTHQV